MRLFGTATNEGKRSPLVFPWRQQVHLTTQKWYCSAEQRPMSRFDSEFNGAFSSSKRKENSSRDTLPRYQDR